MGLRDSLSRALTTTMTAIGGGIAGAAVGVTAGRAVNASRMSTSTALWLADRLRQIADQTDRKYAWCRDCEADDRNNVDGYGYMLVDEVWAEALNGDEIDYLCIPCVCARLQRPLTLEDFADFPINSAVWSGMMLAGGLTPAKVYELQRMAAGEIPFADETRPRTFDAAPVVSACECDHCGCTPCNCDRPTAEPTTEAAGRLCCGPGTA